MNFKRPAFVYSVILVVILGIGSSDLFGSETWTVNGRQAVALKEALERAGARRSVSAGPVVIQIRSVSCLEKGTARGRTSECTVLQDSSPRTPAIRRIDVTGNQAKRLVEALEGAEVKGVRTRRGEVYKTRAIRCTEMPARFRNARCSVTVQ